MSKRYCPEGKLLVANFVEAMRRQAELPASSSSPYDAALEMDTVEAIRSASRHVSDHLLACAICRSHIRRPHNRLQTVSIQ